MPTLRLGSRSSPLARWQTEDVRRCLEALGESCAVQYITTSGDRSPGALAPLGGKGLFTLEIEEALLERRVDIAIHSLKDVPSQLRPELVLGAILQREDPRDVLVAASGVTLANLSPGARVGTGSLRRQVLLRSLRPDLNILPLRGNVDTRLRKWRAGEYDALVLAAAGLIRLQQTGAVSEYLDPVAFCPAAGQGAVALECRAADQPTLDVLARVHHAATGAAVEAERTLLRVLDCGCQAPVAAYARTDVGGLRLTAVVASLDGRRVVRVDEVGDPGVPTEVGRRAGEVLLSGGADEILRELRSTPSGDHAW